MKDKICRICQCTIDVEKEYCEFKHYSKKDIIKSKAFYHIQCFSDRLKGAVNNSIIQTKALEFLDKANAKLEALNG